jgi:hypothetical protein
MQKFSGFNPIRDVALLGDKICSIVTSVMGLESFLKFLKIDNFFLFFLIRTDNTCVFQKSCIFYSLFKIC